MKPIRVMIVEDSPTMRLFLEQTIAADPRLTVVAAYAKAEEAIANLHAVAPDVISLDVRLPGMNGLEATLRIMSERPTPIVIIAADVDADLLNISMNALRSGALAVVAKPAGDQTLTPAVFAAKVCDQLVSMSVVKLVKQRTARQLSPLPTAKGSQPTLTKATGQGPLATASLVGAAASGLFPAGAAKSRYQMLGLVASTGGPNALVTVLSRLPANYPLPMLLVQHITASFLVSFVDWLGGLCPFTVKIAKDGEMPMRGHVYVPPVDHHLEIHAGRLTLTQSSEVCAQRPSGTVLFNSMAKTLGSRAIGVLMTGMGEDGATGLLAMKTAGGYTIAEHESTCIVYGMPGAAVRLGAVNESRPIEDIAARLTQLAEGA